MALAPVGLALIAGSSDYLGPKASLEVILPAMLYLAFWYLLVGFAFWLLALETSGRSIEAIDAALA